MLKTTTKKPLGTAGANETNLIKPPDHCIKSIPIRSIFTDEIVQQREGILDTAIVAAYAEDMKSGATFPPVVVFHDRLDCLWVADGFHRIEAALRAGRNNIQAEVREGSIRDAILCAAGANRNHGLRRTRNDVRRAITSLVKDPEWGAWSDRAIAEKVGCSDKTVAAVRKDLGRCGISAPQDPPTPQPVSEAMKGDDLSGMPQATAMIKSEAPPPPANRTGRDGKSYPPPKAKPAPKPPAPPTKPTPPPAPTKSHNGAKVALDRALELAAACQRLDKVIADLLPEDARQVISNLRDLRIKVEAAYGIGGTGWTCAVSDYLATLEAVEDDITPEQGRDTIKEMRRALERLEARFGGEVQGHA